MEQELKHICSIKASVNVKSLLHKSIKTRFLAINFSDDLINPVELKVMEREMGRVKNGRYIMIQAGEKSLGHQNLSQGALWGPYIAEFLKQLQ